MYTTTDYAKVHNDYRRELLHRSYTHHDRHQARQSREADHALSARCTGVPVRDRSGR